MAGRKAPAKRYGREEGKAIRDTITKTYLEAAELMRSFGEAHADAVLDTARAVASAVARGGTIYLFGNGGSAADSQHLAAEFVNRLARDRAPIAAAALTVDTSVITSIANDSSFDRVFARQIEALGKPADVAFAISTSGDSPNVLAALESANGIGMLTVGLLGRDGGRAAGMVKHALVVPHRAAQRIQEVHILTGHLLAQLIEEELGLTPRG